VSAGSQAGGGSRDEDSGTGNGHGASGKTDDSQIAQFGVHALTTQRPVPSFVVQNVKVL
jgi:hypothetical protein